MVRNDARRKPERGSEMATNVPEPDFTPEGPRYQGRLLARPDEEVVDQGARFDVRTLLNRRALFSLAGLGIGATVLVACSAGGSGPTSGGTSSESSGSSGTTEEIPDETAGPYPGDGSNGPDVLEQSGIVRSDIRTSIGSDEAVDGVPLSFTFTITDLANDGAPFAGVAVYAWHCDAEGRYSMYSDGVEDETWLRGVQVADAKGRVTFTSVVPACYSGRWPHIHFEVYPDVGSIADSAAAFATSQMAFPEDVVKKVYALPAYEGSTENLSRVSLADDNVFGDDDATLQMGALKGSVASGFVATLTAPLDTGTAPSGGAGGPGGGQRP